MPKRKAAIRDLPRLEQQEAQLSEGEAQLENARSQLAALQAQYEEAAASGVYSEEDLAALAAQVFRLSGAGGQSGSPAGSIQKPDRSSKK